MIDYALYGLDPSDPCYDVELHNAPRFPSCWCGQHAEANRRLNCDLQERRAFRMNDPVFCPYCRIMFERGETDAGAVSMVGACRSCFPAPIRMFRRGRRGLSVARARKVHLSDPSRPLHTYSSAELFYEGYDEIPDVAA